MKLLWDFQRWLEAEKNQLDRSDMHTEMIVSLSDLDTQHQPQSRHFGHHLPLFVSAFFFSTLPSTHTFLSPLGGSEVEYWFSLVESSCGPQTPHTSVTLLLLWESSPIDSWRLSDIFSPAKSETPFSVIWRKLDIGDQEEHADCSKSEWLIWKRRRAITKHHADFISYFQSCKFWHRLDLLWSIRIPSRYKWFKKDFQVQWLFPGLQIKLQLF